MSRASGGPHELQPLPPIALIRRIARQAAYTSNRLRHIPIESLEFAARLSPFATVRTSLAVTEALMRRALGVAENSADTVAPRLYPGARQGQDREAFTAPPDARMSVHAMATELLDRSVRQSPRQAVEANQKRLLLQLVPDEARILHVMADGKPRVMEYVGPGTIGLSMDQVLLRYASPVGTEAGVRCLDAVPEYIEHLVKLNLIDVGPEDESLREQYEILDTFDAIEAAETRSKEASTSIGKRLKLKTARMERHTITISERGRDLWEAANPDTHRYVKAEQWEEPEIDMSRDLPPEPDHEGDGRHTE